MRYQIFAILFCLLAACAKMEELSADALIFTNKLVDSIPLITRGPRYLPYRSKPKNSNASSNALEHQMDLYRTQNNINTNTRKRKPRSKFVSKCKPPKWSKNLARYTNIPLRGCSQTASLTPDGGAGSIITYHYGPFDIVEVVGDPEGITISGNFAASFSSQITAVVRSRGIVINSNFDLTSALVHYVINNSCLYFSTTRKADQMAIIAWGLVRATNAGDLKLINDIITDFCIRSLK